MCLRLIFPFEIATTSQVKVALIFTPSATNFMLMPITYKPK